MTASESVKKITIQVNCSECSKPITIEGWDEDFPKPTWRLCEECEYKEEKARYEEYQQKKRKEAEANPLIKYCYEISNKRKLNWEKPFETFEEWIKQRKGEAETPLNSFDDEQEEWHQSRFGCSAREFRRYTPQNFKQRLRYKPDCGMTEDQWWKQIYKKRRELKEKLKQYELDSDLQIKNNPTRQVLDKLSHALEDGLYSGCTCKAEYMRQGQFCPICRLMVKVHDYTLELFKNAAEGRAGV